MYEMSLLNRFLKRGFDVVVASIGLVLTFWLIGIAYFIALIDTKKNGFFIQARVGRSGRHFNVLKIRTMREITDFTTTVTTVHDPRITRVGRFFRKTKIDELPQLVNVFLGHMSFVGPRPDVPGFADKLKGEDRIVLSIRPGITGPATLKYRDEEELLAQQLDPERYNEEVIFPDKVRINREYVKNYTFRTDLKYIFQTLIKR